MTEERQDGGHELVVLIDPKDREIGQMEKLAAHREGRLHRAFSVFVFNAKGELLLQQRAATKYHSASLWTNTCCGHPRPGETLVAAGERRLKEEMGLSIPLRTTFHFTYRAELEHGLVEHEMDHVLIGTSDLDPHPPRRKHPIGGGWIVRHLKGRWRNIRDSSQRGSPFA